MKCMTKPEGLLDLRHCCRGVEVGIAVLGLEACIETDGSVLCIFSMPWHSHFSSRLSGNMVAIKFTSINAWNLAQLIGFSVAGESKFIITATHIGRYTYALHSRG
jgi:hypothetical protein